MSRGWLASRILSRSRRQRSGSDHWSYKPTPSQRLSEKGGTVIWLSNAPVESSGHTGRSASVD
eukprot:3023952-Rhodomonas_salina.1